MLILLCYVREPTCSLTMVEEAFATPALCHAAQPGVRREMEQIVARSEHAQPYTLRLECIRRSTVKLPIPEGVYRDS
jgi:hypothetical protein